VGLWCVGDLDMGALEKIECCACPFHETRTESLVLAWNCVGVGGRVGCWVGFGFLGLGDSLFRVDVCVCGWCLRVTSKGIQPPPLLLFFGTPPKATTRHTTDAHAHNHTMLSRKTTRAYKDEKTKQTKQRARGAPRPFLYFFFGVRVFESLPFFVHACKPTKPHPDTTDKHTFRCLFFAFFCSSTMDGV
jgi:hypothetical protein